MNNPITLKAEGQWSYADTCAAIDALRDAGIECGISVGGLWMFVEDAAEARQAKAIVERHKGWLCVETMSEGLSMQNYNAQQVEALGAKQDFIRDL
jgi:hypothetical protein